MSDLDTSRMSVDMQHGYMFERLTEETFWRSAYVQNMLNYSEHDSYEIKWLLDIMLLFHTAPYLEYEFGRCILHF